MNQILKQLKEKGTQLLKNIVSPEWTKLVGKESVFRTGGIIALTLWLFSVDHRMSLVCAMVLILSFSKRIWWPLYLCSVMVVASNYFVYDNKIDHYILFDLTPAIVAITYQTKDLYYAVLLICFYFGQSGFAKVWHGWLNLNTHTIWSILVFYHENGFSESAHKLLQYDVEWAWEALDYIVSIFEFAFAAAIFYRKLFLALILLLPFFHIGVFAMLEINYSRYNCLYIFVVWCLIGNRNAYNMR